MKTILLVEDNPDDVELTLRALKQYNIKNEIAVVRDGAEALDYLFATGSYAHRDTSDMPSVVILDLKLPKVDGLEVLQSIHKNYPSIKIILTSACDERVYSKLAKKEGALCFIPKAELSLDSLSRICQYSE